MTRRRSESSSVIVARSRQPTFPRFSNQFGFRPWHFDVCFVAGKVRKDLGSVSLKVVKTKAIVFPKPHEIAFREFDLPPCGPDEIVAETLYSFVSPGSEL